MFVVATSMLFNSAMSFSTDPNCREFLGESAFTESYLELICPDVASQSTDKTVNAKICSGSMDPITGRNYEEVPEVKAARERSLKLAIVNQIYGLTDTPVTCDWHCMYDPLNVHKSLADENKRLGFVWRGDRSCWDLTNDWMCYMDDGKNQWDHAISKVQGMCEPPSPDTPMPTDEDDDLVECTEMLGVESFTQDYLDTKCPISSSGRTDKSTSAKICAGSFDPVTGQAYDLHSGVKAEREDALKLAIVNQMYLNCKAHCMYDPTHIESTADKQRVGFIWRGGVRQCWDLVSAFTCFSGAGAVEHATAIAKVEALCPAPVDENSTFEELQERLEFVVATLRELDHQIEAPAAETDRIALLEFVKEAEEILYDLKSAIASQ